VLKRASSKEKKGFPERGKKKGKGPLEGKERKRRRKAEENKKTLY